MRFATLLATAFAPVSIALGQAPAPQPLHPLDGLSAREHWTVYDALVASGKTDSTTRYLYVALREPAKAEVLGWRSGQPFSRTAFVHLIQNKRGYEALVDITGKKVVSWNEVPARQFMTSGAEAEEASELALKDARVIAAIKKRGITDFTHVGCSPSNHGYYDLPEERDRRVVHMQCGDDRNRFSGYGETFEGLVIVAVDILNPVQWSAGNHSYTEWKDKCRYRISLWGGGVNTQTTLPFGSLEDVRNEVSAVSDYLSEDAGYVFCAIHNLLSEVDPEKVIEMYKIVHGKTNKN